jgi:hypothetical protein
MARALRPEAALLAAPPEESAPDDVSRDRAAFEGRVVGYAFDATQSEAFRACGVSEVVRGDLGQDPLDAF